jgi:putative ABC transport system permease protein
LVVLAIAIGVIAFGSVFASKEILIKGMSEQYKATNPTNITITLPDKFDDELIQWAKSQENIKAARGVSKETVRIYTPQGSRNVTLVAIDYSQNDVSQIVSENGTWPPPNRGVVFERKSAEIVGYKLSDDVEIELPNGDKKLLSYAGAAHDFQAIPANMFPELTAYVTMDTLRWLNFNDNYTFLELVTTDSITTKEESDAIASNIKKKLEQKGYQGVSASALKPGKHWGEDVTNAFVTILTIIGSFSLILSVFLVINTISAIIAQQKKQIGIMKAIGGTNQSLMVLYLFMTSIYGLLALLIAIPIGALLSYGNLQLISTFLNLNTMDFYIPLSTLGLEVVASLGVPLIAAAVPVAMGMRVSVREALSDTGTESTKANPIVDRITQKLHMISRPTLLSIRNTFRKKTRLSLTLITLTIAGTLFLSVLSVQQAMLVELDNMLLLYNYDIELFFSQSVSSKTAIKQALKTEGVIEAETPKYALAETIDDEEKSETSLNMMGPPGDFIQVYGLSPESNFMVASIMQGRWIMPEDKNHIVISSKMIRDNPQLGLGKEIRLKINENEHQFIIVGVFMLPDQKMIVIHDKQLKEISPDSENVESVRVRTSEHTGPYLADTAKRLEQNLKKAGFSVAYSLTIDTIRSSSVGQFNFMIGFLMLMAALVAIVGSLSLAGTMSLNVLERTREIGVMRSIGASNRSIRSMVAVESILVGLLSWLLALPLSIPVGVGFCYAIGNAFFEKPLNFLFATSGSIIWLIIIFLIAALASIAPANRAAKLTIRETLSYE